MGDREIRAALDADIGFRSGTNKTGGWVVGWRYRVGGVGISREKKLFGAISRTV